jgi:hypothetical protein
MPRCLNDGVTTIKPGYQATGNARVISDVFLRSVTFGEHPQKPTIRNTWFQQWNTGRLCDGLGSSIVVQNSVGLIITIYGRITAREYVELDNQVHPMIQTLFSNNDAIFQDDSAPIHTAGTVQSWFEEHEWLLHLPLPAQSPDLNIIESLWSVLETRLRNRFPPLTFLTTNKNKTPWS